MPGRALPTLDALLVDDDVKACCAALYQHPFVDWLLGGELHPGGVAGTRRALELIAAQPGARLLDPASGAGTSAMLAAREFGCIVAGVDFSDEAVRGAQLSAEAAGLCDRVGFVVGDAESLPFDDGQFDAVLCECSLCTFPDKPRAMAEIRRVLRPGGRLALADVVVDRRRLPAALEGPIATVACVGEALGRDGYEELLRASGFHLIASESRDEDAAALADRVHDRLRGARVLGLDRDQGSPIAIDEIIELAAAGRRAVAEGALGYAIFAASR